MTNRDLTPVEARQTIVGVCRDLLEGRESVLVAASRIARLRFDIDPDQEDPDLLAFVGIESQEDHLLVYDVDGGWEAHLNGSKKAEIRQAEEFHRSSALESAKRLIERYG